MKRQCLKRHQNDQGETPMRRWMILAVLLALAGCAYDPAARIARFQPFVGQPVSMLVASLGVPSRTYEADGIQFLAYTERRIDYIPAAPLYGPGYGWPYGPMGYPYGGLPPQVIDWVCETTFQVVQDRVQSFTFRGNACG
jgi:hypothetical protein